MTQQIYSTHEYQCLIPEVCVSGDKGDSVGCSGPPGDKGPPGDFGPSGDDLVLVLSLILKVRQKDDQQVTAMSRDMTESVV